MGLLEAMVALTVLVLAGLTGAVLAVQASHALRHAAEAEAELRRASAFLDAVVLWPREDLDRRLGERAQGPWRLRLERPEPTLYKVVLTDSTARLELLRTSVYRPAGGESAP